MRPAPRLAVVVACVLVIGLLALQVFDDGPVTHVDAAATAWLVAHRIGWVTQAMLLVSAAHQTRVLLPLAVAIALVLLWRRQRHLARILVVVPVGMLLNAGLKQVFHRPRPELDDPLVRLATLSFPSGHAAASTVFYGALVALVFAGTTSPRLRAGAVAVGAGMVLLVTFSRIYLGAHYVSDVVAGVAEGIACLALLLPPIRSRFAA